MLNLLVVDIEAALFLHLADDLVRIEDWMVGQV